jgi:hypothetical protein
MPNAFNIIRLACDLSMPLKPPVNIIDGNQVRIHRGKTYRFEIGVYDKETWQESITQFASVTLQVRATRTSAAIIDKTETVPVVTVAEASWDGRTDQHVVLTLTGAQTNALTVPSPFTLNHWLVLTATTAGGEVVTLTAGDILAIEDGGQFSGSTPVSGDPTYLTAAQTIAAIESASRGFQIEANGWIIIPSVDDTGIVTFNARPA